MRILKNRKKFCCLCGGGLAIGDVYFCFGARAVCTECADAITAEDLLHVTGAGGERAMLACLGFEKEVML